MAAADVHLAHEEHPPVVTPSAKMPWPMMGMFFFIGSEIALFGSFFMAYFLIRVVQAAEYGAWAQEFGHVVPLGIALTNLIILLTSSVTVHFAEGAIKKSQRVQATRWLIATIVLGAIFLFIQVKEYADLVTHEEIGPSTNAYSSVFFSITGLHGSHVLVGMIMLTVLLARTIRGHYGPRHDQHIGFRAMSIYWHFVDVVWLFVVGLIYLPGNWSTFTIESMWPF